MISFDDTINFIDNDGEKLIKHLQAWRDYEFVSIRAQRKDINSGSVNRIPFYSSQEKVSDIQANMDGTGIMLIALPDNAGNPDIWVVSKDYAYPLRFLISLESIATISSVTPDPKTRDLKITGDTNVVITPDKTSHSISINVDGLKSLIDSKLASLTSARGTISVSGGTASVIDIDPVKSSTELISKDSNNLIHKGTDSLLMVDPSTAGVQKINNIDPDVSDNFNINSLDNSVSITGGTNSISLSINNTKLISTDPLNSIHEGSDRKLFSHIDVSNINGIPPSSAGRFDIKKDIGITLVPGTNSIVIGVDGAALATNLISTEPNNALHTDSTNKMFVSQSGGGGKPVISPRKTITVNATPTNSEIDIDPIKSSAELISSSVGNAIHKGVDNKLFSTKGIIDINGQPGNTSGAFLVKSNSPIDVASTAPNSINISLNEPTLAGNLVSSSPGNALSKDSSNKLFVNASSAAGIKSISGIAGQDNVELKGAGSTSITVKTDPSTSKKFVEVSSTGGTTIAIASIKSPDGTIAVTGSAINKLIDIDPAKTSEAIIDTAIGNALVQKPSGKLYVAPSLKNINGIGGDASGTINLETTATIEPKNGTRPNSIELNVNSPNLAGTLVSKNTNNALSADSSRLLYVPAAITTLSGITNQKTVDIKGAGTTTVTKKTDPISHDEYIEVSSTGGGGTTTGISTINSLTPDSSNNFLVAAGSGIHVASVAHGINISAEDDPIPDSVYYDDNSVSTKEDGTKGNPFRSISRAVDVASQNMASHSTRQSVRVLDGATLDNTEDFTIGKSSVSIPGGIGVSIIAPNLTFSGDIIVNIDALATNETNRCLIKCYKFSGKIITTGGSVIDAGATKKPGVIIQLNCEKKDISDIKQSFVCDIASLTTPDKEFFREFLSYVEDISEVIETHKTGTQISSSIEFKIADEMKNSIFRYEGNIKAVTSPQNNSRIPYVLFSPVSKLNPTNQCFILIRGLGNNGALFDFLHESGTSSSFLTSVSIKGTSASIENISSTHISGETISAGTRLQAPVKQGLMVHDGDISYNKADAMLYVHSNNVDKPLAFSSSTGLLDFVEPIVEGVVRSRDKYMDISIEPSFSINPLSSSGIKDPNVIKINQSESKAINMRRSSMTIGGKIYSKALSTDEYITAKNTEGHAFIKKLSAISALKFSYTGAVVSPNDEYTVTFSVPTSADKKTVEDNLKTGFAYSFNVTAKEDLAMILTSTPVWTSLSISFKAIVAIGHGTVKNIQPSDLTQANTVGYSSFSLGSGVNSFNWKKDYSNASTTHAFTNTILWIVLFQNKHSKLAKDTVAFLIGHNARNFLNDSSTAGARSFKKEIMPPIILESAVRLLNTAKSNIVSEWLRIPITNRNFATTGSDAEQNNNIVTSGFISKASGSTFNTELYTTMGKADDLDTVISSSLFNDINKNTANVPIINGLLPASYFQDNVIDEINFSCLTFPSANSGVYATIDKVTKIIKFKNTSFTSFNIVCPYQEFIGMNSSSATDKEKIISDLHIMSANFIFPTSYSYRMISESECNNRTSSTSYIKPPLAPSTISSDTKSIFTFI